METEKSFDIYHDLFIDSTVEKVYEAVSQPKHLINWWPLKCKGVTEVGQEYNFYFGDDYNWFGKVVMLIPNETFHIKMTRSDANWNPTSFGFDLEQTDGKVHVKFWHKGWPECNFHFKHSSFCWAMLLNGLKNYVEKGEIVPFEKRN